MSFAVGYTTENPARDYAAAIRKATDRASLIAAIELFLPVSLDAYEAAQALTDGGYETFRKQEKAHHRWKASDPRLEKFATGPFGTILMPAKMLEAAVLSMQMHVPWGLAYLRLEDAGTI